MTTTTLMMMEWSVGVDRKKQPPYNLFGWRNELSNDKAEKMETIRNTTNAMSFVSGIIFLNFTLCVLWHTGEKNTNSSLLATFYTKIRSCNFMSRRKYIRPIKSTAPLQSEIKCVYIDKFLENGHFHRPCVNATHFSSKSNILFIYCSCVSIGQYTSAIFQRLICTRVHMWMMYDLDFLSIIST